MWQGAWKSIGLRLGVFVLGYAALYWMVESVGFGIVPSLQGMDQAISDAVQPDQYLFFVDEFFRALTDYTTPLISVSLISLLLAITVYRLRSAEPPAARKLFAKSLAIWWVLVGVVVLLAHPKPGTVFGLALFIPLLLLILAGLPAIVPPLRGVAPRKYVTAVLWVETAIFVIVWAWGKLLWNEGLPGANYLLLAALIVCFGGTTVAFARMREETMGRFVGIFGLVMLSSIACGVFGTGAIKDAVARPRPLAEANQPWNAAMRAIPEETLRGASSYPSGHVSGTVSLLTPLFWWVRSRKAKAGLALWGTLQGVSRIYTAAHFFSDCVMGAFFGFGVGTLVFFLLGGVALRAPAEAE